MTIMKFMIGLALAKHKLWNIPILPIGILHFCKKKLAAPPLGAMGHLVHSNNKVFCTMSRNKILKVLSLNLYKTKKAPFPGGAKLAH